MAYGESKDKELFVANISREFPEFSYEIEKNPKSFLDLYGVDDGHGNVCFEIIK